MQTEPRKEKIDEIKYEINKQKEVNLESFNVLKP